MDGQTVFGGHDAAKVTGPNITQKLLPWTLGCPCGMLMTMFNMQLNFANGSTADMLYPSTVSACLQPDWPTLISPRYYPFFDRFQVLTGTYEVEGITSFYGGRHFAASVFSGGLTMKLAEGLQVTIPNNTFDPVVLMAPTSDVKENDNPIIGRPFFSSAYLMVDLDAGTFTLWPANATSGTRLVAIGGNCASNSGPIVNTVPANTTSTTPSSTPSSNSTINSTSTPVPSAIGALSTGAIIGIAIGALAVLLGFLALMLLKRRRRGNPATSASGANIPLNKYGHEFGDYGWQNKYDGQPLPLQELFASQDHPHELFARDKPVEAPGMFGGRSQAVEMP